MKTDSLVQQARNEVQAEINKEAKEELKVLLRERVKAQKLVDAIDHKIEVAEAKLS